jgi:hypothetical protein
MQCKKLHSGEEKFRRCLKTSNLNISKRTKIIAAVAIFSALYSVLRILPTVPMIGAQGASFSVSDVLAPLYGILLGPYVGGAAVIIGTFLGMAMGKPVVFLGLDFLPALVNVLALGFLVRRKWWPAILLNIALLVAFSAYPLTSLFINVGSLSVPFAWMHIAAFIVLLSPLGRKAGQWVESLKPALLAAGIAILAFIGTMMQHLMGNILFETILAQPIGYIETAAYPAIWSTILFVYPFERLALIILAVLVGTPLVRVLKKSILNDSNSSNPGF